MTRRPPIIVGLTGFAGSGKSTVAEIFSREHGFVIHKFAQPLKDMLLALGLNQNELEGENKDKPNYKLCQVTPRRAMQTLGTEWGRDLIHEKLWTNLLVLNVMHSLSQGYHVVVDDLRFQNEAEALHKLGAKVGRVLRPDQVRGAEAEHPSETQQLELGNLDFYILNSATKGELSAHVDLLMKQWETESHV